VTYNDGKQELYYAPLESMRGLKPAESDQPRTVLPDHRWVDPAFTFVINRKLKDIARIDIDPTKRLADVDAQNNTWTP
jgi:hypothetical protein